MEQELKPNDVIIILRPTIKGDNEWAGEYTLMLTAIGPLSISVEDAQKLLSAALMIASTASLMEIDTEVAEKVRAHCEVTLGIPDEETIIPNITAFDTSFTLTEDTPTSGGVQ